MIINDNPYHLLSYTMWKKPGSGTGKIKQVNNRSQPFFAMPKGSNKKRRAKKRKQERARAALPVAAEATASATPAKGFLTARQVASAAGGGITQEEVVRGTELARELVGRMKVGELQKALFRARTLDSSKLHTSIEQTRGATGGDYHCWFETKDREIYNLPGGERFAGDVPKYDKDNLKTPYNVREAS